MKRPDGPILCLLAGNPYPADDPPDSFARDVSPGGSALPVFADLRCLHWAAEDLGKKPDSFDIAGIHPRNLIAMAAEGDLGIAICTYRDRKMPMYVIVPDSLVKTVAEALERRKLH